jgi:hypothetical protein
MKVKKFGALASVVPAVAGAAVLTATPASAGNVANNGCYADWISAPSPTAGWVQAQGTGDDRVLPGICWVRVHAKVGNDDVYTSWTPYSSCCAATERINARVPYVISWAKIEVQRY